MNSIRKKLLRWLLVGQLLAVVLTGTLTFVYVRGEVADLFDDRLRQLAYSIPDIGPQLSSPPPLTNLQDDDDDFVIQVWREDGTQLQLLNKKEGTPKLAEAGYSTHLSGKMLWRSYVLHHGERLIQISQPYSDRIEMSTGVALGAIAPVLILILALGGLVWISVNRGLRPLQELTRDLGLRRPYSLEPLDTERLPDEVTPLGLALNGLLERLAEALEGQRKFIADAAHELRTPLAAVKLQVQLLERATEEQARVRAIEHIRAGSTRASHLVTQLLTLARMEPQTRQRPFGQVDLSALMKSVVVDHAPAARQRAIDLGVNQDQAVTLLGDGESLRITLSNLIDNAIRYTPPGGQVDVSLYQDIQAVRLEVVDTGPGIPVSDREEVFARFYRRPGTKELGSGLGLAIVQEIVKHHRGTVSLAEGANQTGLKVSINLPIDSCTFDATPSLSVKGI